MYAKIKQGYLVRSKQSTYCSMAEEFTITTIAVFPTIRPAIIRWWRTLIDRWSVAWATISTAPYTWWGTRGDIKAQAVNVCNEKDHIQIKKKKRNIKRWHKTRSHFICVQQNQSFGFEEHATKNLRGRQILRAVKKLLIHWLIRTGVTSM